MLQRNVQIMILWTLLFASWGYSQEKHALLVGVGDHIYESYRLLGPKNDIPAFRDLLINKYGFNSENIKVLQDKDATRSNIIAAFERRLIAPVQEGDLALFYFTGHGTQVTDYSRDEPDKRDEAFVPYDGKTISTLLVDDDLAALINRINTPDVIVILDACHSGTGTRGVARARRIAAREFEVEDEQEAPNPPKTNGDATAEEFVDALVLSAAQPDQIAVDYPFLMQESPASKAANPNMGALTYYLLRQAWLDKNNQFTYKAMNDLVCADLENNGFGQTPLLEGPAHNPFLMLSQKPSAQPDSTTQDTLTHLTAQANAEVIAVHDDEVTIQAIGAVQFVRGSIFETTERSIDNEPNAIRLTEISGHTAIGSLVQGSVEIGDRLVEMFHFVPQSKLRLAVVGDSSLVHKARKSLAHLDFAQLVRNEEFHDVEFEVDQTTKSVSITPYRNQHRLPDIYIHDLDSLAVVTKPLLENLFAVKLLTSLRNPNPPFKVDVQVNGKDYDEIGIGEEIAFTVTVDHDAYVYLLDFDPAGNVTVLFPNIYVEDNFLKAGTVYEMPAQKLYQLQVSGPAGPELVKAIATTTPLTIEALSSASNDFSSLAASAVDVAQAIIDQLKREVNRLTKRGISVLPAAPAEQPISTQGWTTDDVLIRVVE